MRLLASMMDANERIEIDREPVDPAEKIRPKYIARIRSVSILITKEERDALLADGAVEAD
jgi:hypothetical protein